jgi:hypothetical protein
MKSGPMSPLYLDSTDWELGQHDKHMRSTSYSFRFGFGLALSRSEASKITIELLLFKHRTA